MSRRRHERVRVEAPSSSVRVELADAEGPADLANRIDWLEDRAVSLASAGGLPAEDAHFLGIALREAIVNAVKHGRRPDGRCDVVVRLRSAFGRLLLMWVRDRGPGFDPSGVGDPLLPENLRKGNGRGLFYMRCFVDRLRFSFPRDGGVAAHLVKRLPGARPPAD